MGEECGVRVWLIYYYYYTTYLFHNITITQYVLRNIHVCTMYTTAEYSILDGI